jgi:hypothetical protein
MDSVEDQKPKKLSRSAFRRKNKTKAKQMKNEKLEIFFASSHELCQNSDESLPLLQPDTLSPDQFVPSLLCQRCSVAMPLQPGKFAVSNSRSQNACTQMEFGDIAKEHLWIGISLLLVILYIQGTPLLWIFFNIVLILSIPKWINR